MRVLALAALAALALAGPARAQIGIDPNHQYAWGENIGWMNWRDAGDPPGSRGVLVHDTYLSGLIWGETSGWIDTGAGSPADGAHYANADSSDFGVNIDPSGDLYGYAWGENIGWIQFDTRDRGDERARLDRPGHRFRGYAWGENAGWINLDAADQYVGILLTAVFLRGDATGSSGINLTDVIVTFGCLFLGGACPQCLDAADANDDGDVDVSDPIFTIRFLFQGGKIPPDPGPFACGPDPTPDALLDCQGSSCP